MHELAVCQALLDQVAQVARDNDAPVVTGIVIRLGPLSGIEAGLLRRAFSVARSGTVAETGVLSIEPEPVTIACRHCGIECRTTPNRLVCPSCARPCPHLVSGDSLTLVSIEVARDPVTQDPVSRDPVSGDPIEHGLNEQHPAWMGAHHV